MTRAAGLTTWVDADVRREFEARGDWTDEVWLDRFLADVEADPQAVAVVDESGALTRGEVLGQARRLAAYLGGQGIGRGDVMTLVLPNWSEFVVVHAAAGLAGCVVNPVLPRLGAADLRHVLTLAGSRAVFAAGMHRSVSPLELVLEAASGLDRPPLVVGVRTAGESDLPDLAMLLATPWEAAHVLPSPVRDAGSADTITFTSGTEALPKGVVHSHRSTMFGLRAFIGGVLGLGPGDCVFMPSPICHASGLQWGLRTAAYAGVPLVLQDRWDPAVAAELIGTHGCTYTLAATPFVVDLLAAHRSGSPGVDRLRYIASGGAPIPRHLVAEVRDALDAELIAVFGSSETYVATTARPGDPEHLMATDGAPLPGVEVQILDPTGCPVPSGVDGEIVTRGPHVFLGYLGDPTLTTGSFTGQWYHYGDIGRFDADGRLHVTGRIKDIVIRGGENISVREVEDLLSEHPLIGQVAVVGYPDPRLGERCCAVVRPPGREAPTLADLVEYLRARGLPTFKSPERLEIVGEMPMTVTGKIRKSRLRELVAAGPISPS